MKKITTKKELSKSVGDAIKQSRKDEDSFLMITELALAVKKGLYWDEFQQLRDEMTRILIFVKPHSVASEGR